MTDLIPAIAERWYREIAKPQPQRLKPALTIAGPKAITRADVDDILRRKRSASPEELQEIIARAAEFKLLEFQRNQICVDLSIVVAQRARGMNGQRENPAAEFLSKILGLAETPYGMIPREWVNRQMQMGSQAIAGCRNHRPPECDCWTESRSILFQASAGGPKTPEAWAAMRVYEVLAELELASKPERD